jgi:hypothetical protein
MARHTPPIGRECAKINRLARHVTQAGFRIAAALTHRNFRLL